MRVVKLVLAVYLLQPIQWRLDAVPDGIGRSQRGRRGQGNPLLAREPAPDRVAGRKRVIEPGVEIVEEGPRLLSAKLCIGLAGVLERVPSAAVRPKSAVRFRSGAG